MTTVRVDLLARFLILHMDGLAFVESKRGIDHRPTVHFEILSGTALIESFHSILYDHLNLDY